MSNKSFLSEYQKLNPEQKLAVDTIEGPVMVIAGAGTGKTQTITLRVGKILEETQTNPSSILCLTFTDSAALNMRSRLLNLIGSDAYGVRICTFHAFCNSVIKDNPQYFLFSQKESIPLDDVKKIQIIRSLIDKLPQASQLKNINALYFYQNEISKNIQNLKKENITPDKFEELINNAADFVKISDSFADKLGQIRATSKASSEITNLVKDLIYQLKDLPVYQTKINLFLNLYGQESLSLSDFKKSVRDLIEKTGSQISKQKDLLILYRGYQQQLIEQNLYDYEDMILWVINAFKNNRELLLDYQEKFQYILVDEFQDSNNAQYEIINLLTQNQETPNIFVVGDDDQSIYRFQGASIENIFSFYQKYQKDIKVIILKNNYRSHKLILDSSNNVISHNENRISRYIENLDKSLKSVKTFDPDPINLFAASNFNEENFYVANKIKELIKSGTKPSEIAVLFRNNSDVNDLLPYLSQLNIKYLRSDSIDIFESVEIQQLVSLFQYLVNPINNETLGKILSFNFLDIKSIDLYKLYLYTYKTKESLFEIIGDKNKLHDLEISPSSIIKLNNFYLRVAKIQKLIQNKPLPDIFNFVIRKFKFLSYVLRHRDIETLKQLNTLYSQLKNSLSIEKIDLKSWVENILLLQENKLDLKSPPLIDDLENSIKLMTVHKSKGLEFEHVFLIKVLSGKWDNSASRSLIKLPLGISASDAVQIDNKDIEEDRRLFYVALTRAKNQIYISYPKFNDNGKEQLHSVFINEIDDQLIDKKSSDSQTEAESLRLFFTPQNSTLLSKSLSGYIKNYLDTTYKFNITHLNSYLKCPLCFFFKTILHLPQSKTTSLSFGTSVHGALSYLYTSLKKDNILISLEKFLDIFKQNLDREQVEEKSYQDLLEKGKEVLTKYYENYKNSFTGNYFSERDFKFYGARLGNIPITGKIDLIDVTSKNEANVIDFKTGRPDGKYQQLSPDGDYFRQLVFYKILCQQSKGFPYQINQGTIDFIETNQKNQFERKTFNLTQDDVNKLTILIQDTFQKISNLEFAPSDTCNDPDHLHYLFDKYFKNES
ncbi:MAG TPA: ATP-dependent DNA helicase [Candidatus Woesebacteria bacterium]|nr:ATP-dependent DNA helicase [Candidatus Woesebacteria bacterium]